MRRSAPPRDFARFGERGDTVDFHAVHPMEDSRACAINGGSLVGVVDFVAVELKVERKARRLGGRTGVGFGSAEILVRE